MLVCQHALRARPKSRVSFRSGPPRTDLRVGRDQSTSSSSRRPVTIVAEPTDTPEAEASHSAPADQWLPARYREPWVDPFLARVHSALGPGARVLDVGSGARPAIPRELRPEGCHYVGLDVSAWELDRAGADAYDERLVGDICARLDSITGRFDLVLSWQVLEHVASMRAALATQHTALVPGGRMVAMLSGAWSIHALAARVIPYRVSTWLQMRLLGSPPEDKFPTRYDACTDRALRRLLAEGGWDSWEVVPRYRSGIYLSFSRPLQRGYVAYESWAAQAPRRSLATHYIIDATA